MDDILFRSHRAWAFNPEYDFAKKNTAKYIYIWQLTRYCRAGSRRCLLSATRLDTFAFIYDLTIKIIVIIIYYVYKKEGFDDRVRLCVNGEDRFFPSKSSTQQKD